MAGTAFSLEGVHFNNKSTLWKTYDTYTQTIQYIDTSSYFTGNGSIHFVGFILEAEKREKGIWKNCFPHFSCSNKPSHYMAVVYANDLDIFNQRVHFH